MSLRWRIVVALGSVAAAVGVAAAAGSYVTTSQRLRDAIDETLVARAADVVAPDHDRPDRREPAGFGQPDDVLRCPPAGMVQPAAAAQVVATDGTVTACIPAGVVLPVDGADLALAAQGGEERLRTITVDGLHLRVLSTPWGDGGGVLQIGRDLAETDSVLSALRLRLGALVAGSVVAAALAGWLLAGRLVRPVARLRDTAEAIAATQDLTTPIPVAGDDEVGSLARSFGSMVGALALSRDQQQRLITDASHEMRTPLTSLRTNLELLDRLDELEPAERREVIGAAQVDLGELTHLLTELVELSTDPSSDDPVGPVDLADVAEAVAGRTRRRSGRPVTVTVGAAGTVVPARAQMVERAIANLVENAVKYSPDGSPVDVRIDGGRVEVRDRGPGIAQADRDHVFERFWRSTTARSEPGSGLGLAIVKQVVDRHGGDVFVAEADEGGALVGFELPGGGARSA